MKMIQNSYFVSYDTLDWYQQKELLQWKDDSQTNEVQAGEFKWTRLYNLVWELLYTAMYEVES